MTTGTAVSKWNQEDAYHLPCLWGVMPTLTSKTIHVLGRGVVSVGKPLAWTQDRELLLAVSTAASIHSITSEKTVEVLA
ncbi:MAG: hypothetical protein TQ37_10410 [Candidatus Synechococcus spongiarum 15L]|uniref:Uncharacterized protein n=1 Tax=Candidatus Synechococcus spongiarum 15L TaxID=1608419 RepID=A0A0G8AQX7_9SYNE|nr:MAG: hypothetical protein TQ37_10410 [Candidatus Synechococcus spongiarum 15L]